MFSKNITAPADLYIKPQNFSWGVLPIILVWYNEREREKPGY